MKFNKQFLDQAVEKRLAELKKEYLMVRKLVCYNPEDVEDFDVLKDYNPNWMNQPNFIEF